MEALQRLNSQPIEEAHVALERCCGSRRWVEGVLARRPFATREDLFETAAAISNELEREDWLEAFTHHPKIGNVDSLRRKFANTATWAAGEQAGATGASDEVLYGLARGNDLYEARFGYIFIVCATDKSAAEMLALLEARLPNERQHEDWGRSAQF